MARWQRKDVCEACSLWSLMNNDNKGNSCGELSATVTCSTSNVSVVLDGIQPVTLSTSLTQLNAFTA